MFNIYKLIFTSTLFLSTLITISSYSWMGVWMGLEINLLSFIPLISNKNNPNSSESSIKYFLVQALASSILLFSILLMMLKTNMINDFIIFKKMILLMMNSSILLKLGSAPFHFWFPDIIEGLNWMNSLILMTWQKIAPMMIMSYIMKISSFLFLIILITTFVGSIGGLNQTSLRKIMVYSSINHIGWMLSTFLINESLWLMYFLIYSFIVILISLIFYNMNIFYLKQIYFMKSNFYYIKFMMMLNLLSLGGLPPFLGFLPKWIIIQNLSFMNFFLILFMIMMSLITLFFYIRIMYSSMMIMNNELNFNLILNKNIKNNIFISMFTFFSLFGLILYSIIFNFL